MISFREKNKYHIVCMTVENVELMHECFPKHLRMGTARMKEDKDTEEEGHKRTVNKWNIRHEKNKSH